jgi:hypothetical protein
MILSYNSQFNPTPETAPPLFLLVTRKHARNGNTLETRTGSARTHLIAVAAPPAPRPLANTVNVTAAANPLALQAPA